LILLMAFSPLAPKNKKGRVLFRGSRPALETFAGS
jgi:hypothetical protein